MATRDDTGAASRAHPPVLSFLAPREAGGPEPEPPSTEPLAKKYRTAAAMQVDGMYIPTRLSISHFSPVGVACLRFRVCLGSEQIPNR